MPIFGEGYKRRFAGMIMPESGCKEYKGAIYSQDRENKDREWLINFPLYDGINKLWIGIAEGSTLKKAPPFTVSKPVVFYGSSITQGGCASRPGTTYVNYLSRWLNAPVVNLGFCGNAKGEPEMAELISKLDMSAFVLDYDECTIDRCHPTDLGFWRMAKGVYLVLKKAMEV
jgi:hypothetical protein